MSSQTQRINTQELIPWSDIHAPTREDLVFLGCFNLERIKQYWQREEREVASHIMTVQSEIEKITKEGPERKNLKSELNMLNQKKVGVRKSVRYISNTMKRAEEKPCFASHRPGDWFEIGDKVVCFISKNLDYALKKSVFITGKVVDGYRHRNGCVSVYADEKIHTDSYCNGHGLSFGISRPEVMHEWEYEYLKTHPEYLSVWIKASADSYNFSPMELTKAFSR